MRVNELRADREDRIEGRHRVLKDHCDLLSAQAAEFGWGQIQQIAAAELDPARYAAGIAGQQAEQSQSERRLTATTFTDQPDDTAALDGERNIPQHMQRTLRYGEIDRQLMDAKQVFSAHGSRLSLGSIASRRLSPNSVNPSVAMVSMPPDTSTGQTDCSR